MTTDVRRAQLLQQHHQQYHQQHHQQHHHQQHHQQKHQQQQQYHQQQHQQQYHRRHPQQKQHNRIRPNTQRNNRSQQKKDMRDEKPKFGRLFKSILYWSNFLDDDQKTVTVPEMTTYNDQIEHCQEMYSRLQLNKVTEFQTKSTTNIFPFLRSRTMVTQSRPTTYKMRQRLHPGGQGGTGNRPVSIRSAPAISLQIDHQEVLGKDHNKISESDEVMSQSTDCELDKDGHGRKRSKMDPEKLAEYLNERGLGLPSVNRSSQTFRRPSLVFPRGWKSRPLPKNPSSREKIKGRARLDQEMANMKALAFCEQQAPKAFRTASANMRNRDVQFMEEELRDNIHKEVDGLEADGLDFDDDNASIVMMPIKQDELILRINTWIDEVESACKSHHNHQKTEGNKDTPVELSTGNT